MPTTFANTIDSYEILAKRSQCDYAGNDLQTTYATKSEVTTGLASKQDTISDLATIRSGAAAGATAVQPGDLATVATTGAYSDLTGTPTIPTATSDLTNDSGFITLSDVPAQVNADWNAVSGAAEILNKPTINNVPAVTSSDDNKVLKASYTGGVGSYSWENESTEVPSYTTSEDGKVLGVVDNQGTAELQWVTGGGSSTSDVYVMDGTESFNDIWNKYQAGTVIYYWTTKPNSSAVYEPYLVTFIKSNDSTHTSGTITYTCLDRQSSSLLFNLYSGVSNGYASGFGVVSKNITQLTLGGSNGQTLVFNSYGHLAPATINQVPAYTTSEDGKVLGVVNNSGTASLEWVVQSAGGTQADWTEDDPTDPSYIENKPTPKTLTGGTGISITESANAITITNTATPPTVDQTYNAASTNAQSGTAVADAIGNLPTNLTAAQIQALKEALGCDETVLWEGNAASSFTVSESISNFEYLRVYMNYNGMNTWCYGTIVSNAQFTIACVGYANNSGDLNRLQMFGGSFTSSNGLAFSSEAGKCIYFANASAAIGGGTTGACNILKIVGIHRIAST